MKATDVLTLGNGISYRFAAHDPWIAAPDATEPTEVPQPAADPPPKGKDDV